MGRRVNVHFGHRGNTDNQNKLTVHLAAVQRHEPSMVEVLFSWLAPYRANKEAMRRSKNEHGDHVRTQGSFGLMGEPRYRIYLGGAINF